MSNASKRSRAYPAIPLGQAVDYTRVIVDALGKGKHDRDAIADALGHKAATGIAARKIAALAYYGLLEREKDKYAPTDLADQILHPTSEGERLQGLKKAFLAPDLFQEVYEVYSPGGRLPGQLGNLLYRNHRITRKVSEDAAKVIVESGKIAGVLDEDGRFVNGHSIAAPNPSVGTDEKEPSFGHQPAEKHIRANPSPGLLRHEVKLHAGVAQVIVPAQISSKDIAKLKKLIELLELDILDEVDTPPEGGAT